MPITTTASDSRYKNTEIISIDGIETYGRWVEPNFTSDPVTTTYTVPAHQAGRPDLISDQLYGNVKLYWAIIAYNSPENPLNWPPPNVTIAIPSLQSILSEM